MGKNADLIEIAVPVWNEDGSVSPGKFKITPMMRVALYMHSLNEQNLWHIKEGGLKIPNIRQYLKGNIEQAYAKGTVVKMEPETVREIVSHCTAQEKAFAKCLQNYFEGENRNMINETSLVLEGMERA